MTPGVDGSGVPARERDPFGLDVPARVDVAVVGGGPVGLALAIDLGRRGVRCALLEQRPIIDRIPKGQNLTPRTMEHLAALGCADDVRRARTIARGTPVGSLTVYGSLTGDRWYATAGRQALDRHHAQAAERLPQYRTEEVLRRRVGELEAVHALFGWRVAGLRQGDDAIEIDVEPVGENAALSGRRTLQAAYLVGCDGAHSLVRRAAGIGRQGRRFDTVMVLVVFRSKELDAVVGRFPPRSTYRVLRPELQGYWQFFGRVDDEGRWFFHCPLPTGADVGEGTARGLVHEAAGVRVDCEVEHVGRWEFRTTVADHYRRGRVLLAGDACHSHPPYGGFGLNTGIEDAANLGWKLDAVLAGWGGDGLLGSYEAERRPVARETIDVILRRLRDDADFLRRCPDPQADGFEDGWDALAAADAERTLAHVPHYAGSAIVAAAGDGRSPGALGAYSSVAVPGHLLPPHAMGNGQQVHDQLGSGFSLLAAAFDGPAAALSEAARRRAVPLSVVAIDAPARAAYGAPLVLVRPDGYVAWTGGEGTVDADAVLDVVTGSAVERPELATG